VLWFARSGVKENMSGAVVVSAVFIVDAKRCAERLYAFLPRVSRFIELRLKMPNNFSHCESFYHYPNPIFLPKALEKVFAFCFVLGALLIDPRLFSASLLSESVMVPLRDV
jgi:hypothetical protein